VLETIEVHDYRDLRPTHSSKALLLREADMLEFLGMIGMAREFARGPKDVEICQRRILERVDYFSADGLILDIGGGGEGRPAANSCAGIGSTFYCRFQKPE
jgi:hypothetical protein